MRTQVKSPPIQAASGSAAMIATISSHSAIIRTNGVNRVIGTSSAATRPAAPKRPRISAPHNSGPPAVAGECRTYLTTPTQTAATAAHTNATAWRLSAKALPRLMKIRTNSPARTNAAPLRRWPGVGGQTGTALEQVPSGDGTEVRRANSRRPQRDSGSERQQEQQAHEREHPQ